MDEKEKNAFFKKIEPYVKRRIGETYGEVMEDAWTRYCALRHENADETKAVAMHTVRIYSAIAVFEASSQRIGREAAVQLIGDFYTVEASRMADGFRRLLKLPGLYRLVPGIFSRAMAKMFGEAAGFKYRSYNEGKRVYRVDMLRCPYFETTHKYGCPELCTVFCDSDDVSYGNMHPKLLWKRTKTLGRGHDCCDFNLQAVE